MVVVALTEGVPDAGGKSHFGSYFLRELFDSGVCAMIWRKELRRLAKT
jgi:hypothetical protein